MLSVLIVDILLAILKKYLVNKNNFRKLRN